MDSQFITITGSNSNIFKISNTSRITASNYTIYVKAENNSGCNGMITPVSFSIDKTPVSPIVSGNLNEYC